MKAQFTNIDERPIYSVAEFCATYRISRTAFYAEVKSDRLCAVKRGRLTFVTKEAAIRWIMSLPNYETRKP